MPYRKHSLRFVQLFKDRFHDEFTEVLGIEPGALNANEAQCLAFFRSIDAIRNRIVTAEQEIDRRLRSKGMTLSDYGGLGQLTVGRNRLEMNFAEATN